MVGNMEIKFQKTQNLPSKDLNSRMYRGKQINKNLAFKKGNSQNVPKTVKEAIEKNSDIMTKFLTWMGNNEGELMNVLVNFFGTAAICPIFIRYNPLTKEDKKKKAYSAWRQPLSAIISVVTQVFVTSKVNSMLAKRVSTGYYDRADLRACPEAGYLKKEILKEHPELKKNRIELDNEVARRASIAEMEVITDKLDTLKGKEIEKAEYLNQEVLEKARTALTEEYKTAHPDEVAGMSEKKIERFMKSKLSNEDIQNRALEIVDKEIKQETEIERVLQNVIKDKKSVEEVLEVLEKTPEEVNKLVDDKIISDKSNVIKNLKERLIQAKNYETKHSMNPLESLKKVGTEEAAIQRAAQVRKLVHSTIKKAQNVSKNFKKEYALIVNLITLPFTCTFLNWVYPRVMEYIMPEVAKQKATGGNK